MESVPDARPPLPEDLPEGPELDGLVAEAVMREPQPTAGHDRFHVDPVPSTGGSWVCRPEYERGDVCEWHPVPFSTRMSAAWSVVERLEPLVSRFETGDGFLHLSVGHWADHDDCTGEPGDSPEEDPAEDPRPLSFHIHLGFLAADDDFPTHWAHGQRYCASAATAPLAICRAALRAFAGPRA
jgi:hypothetical protein